MADTFNSYFIYKVEKLVGENRSKAAYRSLQKVVDVNPKSMYFGLILEEKIATEVSNLRIKSQLDVMESLIS
jgi:hypothetical protein